MRFYRDKWKPKTECEMRELEEKKSRYGWTKADVERYRYLLKGIRFLNCAQHRNKQQKGNEDENSR